MVFTEAYHFYHLHNKFYWKISTLSFNSKYKLGSRSVLFCDFTQRRMAIRYRRFVLAFRSNFQGTISLGLRLDVSATDQMLHIKQIPEKTRECFAVAHPLFVITKTAKVWLKRGFITFLLRFYNI